MSGCTPFLTGASPLNSTLHTLSRASSSWTNFVKRPSRLLSQKSSVLSLSCWHHSLCLRGVFSQLLSQKSSVLSVSLALLTLPQRRFFPTSVSEVFRAQCLTGTTHSASEELPLVLCLTDHKLPPLLPQEFSPRSISSLFLFVAQCLTGRSLCLRGAVGAFRRRPFALSLSFRTRHPSRSVSLSQTCRHNLLASVLHMTHLALYVPQSMSVVDLLGELLACVFPRVCQLFTDNCQFDLYIE